MRRIALTAVLVLLASTGGAAQAVVFNDLIAGTWNQPGPDALRGESSGGAWAWTASEAEPRNFTIAFAYRAGRGAEAALQVRSHRLPALDGDGQATDESQWHGYRILLPASGAERAGNVVLRPSGETLVATSTDAAETFNPGGWNQVRVMAKGPIVEVHLNGVPANRLLHERFLSGRLALGVRGAAEFRDVSFERHPYEGAWRALFDGETLDGWEVWGTEEWSVEDAALIGRSGPDKSEGYLLTEDVWRDFRVRGQYKMLGEGNFGLFFKSSIAYNEDDYPVISGIQGEVAPGRPSPSGLFYESYRRGWLTPPDMADPAAWAQRPGEWNEVEIRAIGNRTTSWINGMRTADFVDPNPQLFEGGFALQLHAGGVDGVMWREIYVKRPLALPPGER